jgi:DivIVA domain-containing protein
MNDADPCDPVLNGDEVRNITFGKGLYDASQVDDLLDRIAAELDAGRPAGPLIASATFKQRPFARGYDIGAVDWFLDQLRTAEHSGLARMNADPWRDLAADPYYIHREPGDPAGRIRTPSSQEYAEAWRNFGQQPGTLLSWVLTGAGRRELRTPEQQTIASSRGGLWTSSPTLTAGGRTFTWKRVTRSSWPGIADTISHDWPGGPQHIVDRGAGKKDSLLGQLCDETGMPVLYTAGRHFNRDASGYIKFPGQRWLRFPVRGTRRADVIMTAVDQAGNKVARYRLIRYGRSVRRTTEITVHPDRRLTDELALVIAASAPWLSLYFWREGGGG